MEQILSLFANAGNITWQMAVMWLIGGILIFLAIYKKMEPTLLLPMGFGAILVNLPFSGAITQIIDGKAEHGALDILFDAGVGNELFTAGESVLDDGMSPPRDEYAGLVRE